MKKIFFLLFCLTPFLGIAQSTTADPALEPMEISTLEGVDFVTVQLPQNSIVKLKVPILNKNIANFLPGGTCKIKIGLGSKATLDPSFDLSTVNTSNYFNWTAVSSGGQVQITGELIAELPANFSDTAFFDIKGTILGNSTITTNFLVTNHNSTTLLSDENGANNIASTPYLIIEPITLPLVLDDFSVSLQNCKQNLKWITSNEIGTSHFDIERAIAGNNWSKIGTVNATSNSSITATYSFLDDNIQNFDGKVFYRLKMVDKDGNFKYSKIIAVFNNCNKAQINIYPNPVANGTINLTIAGFSKNATAVLKTISGTVVALKTVYNGINTIDVTKFSSGVYMLTIYDKDSNIENFKVIVEK